MARRTPATPPGTARGIPPANGGVAIPKLQHALLLNRYFCRQIGTDTFTGLQRKLHDIGAGLEDDGLTFWYHVLRGMNGLRLPGGAAKLAEYDRRVTGYVERLNVTRANPRIVLTYYQWLALIFTEMFLDRLYNDGDKLRRELNVIAHTLNAGGTYGDLQPAYTGRGAWQYPTYATEADLKKVAFWAATGSGKTLLMHVHLWQWRFHAQPTPQNGGVLLITPSESLSGQHLGEFAKSGITAARYEDAGAGGLFADGDGTPPVIVIEITKLTKKKRGGGQSVSVAEFEAFGLVLVDEGHRGASGEEWRELRGAVGQNALTLEYSATFGQIVNGATAAKKPALLSEYASAILFDFSYPHFYADGYGKDYNILNSGDDSDTASGWVMLANLLSYYEQCLAYAANPDALRAYNIERPLWIFVGHTVVGRASSGEDRETLSDVQTVAGFFADFLADRTAWTERVAKALTGDHPLKADGSDLLERRFPYLRGLNRSAGELWLDIVRVVFRASAGDTLTTVELRAANGEIGLRAGAANPYFGVINIGDSIVGDLQTLLKGQGIAVEDDAVGAGLFAAIKMPESPVNVLIGSRKFMEGWDSFRVSSMGLLNIGQGEGSQIIQLFGRGVRLHGKNYSLKRSAFLRGETATPPPELRLLETLNVFGVKASYMAKFRVSLKNEGITTDVEEVEVPIRIADASLKRGLRVLRVQGTFSEAVPLRVETGIKINLDLRPRVESASGGLDDLVTEDAAGLDQTSHLRRLSPLLDWGRLTIACMNFRRDKGLNNLAFDTAALQAVFHGATIVVLGTPGYFRTDKFSGLDRVEEVVLAALTKYIATYYERRRKEWETKNLRLEPLTEADGNLAFGKYVIKVSTDKPQVAKPVNEIVTEAKDLYDKQLEEADGLPTAYIANHLYQPLLCGWDELDNVKPTGLEPSEIDFIADLRAHLQAHPDVLQGRDLFLLRNQVTYGIVFYDETGSGFYPDFLLWLVAADGAQTLVFIDPHGIGREPLTGAKIQLHRRLRDDIAPRLREQHPDINLRLDAFILAPTHAGDRTIPIIVDNSPEVLAANHILFQKGEPYIEKLFAALD